MANFLARSKAGPAIDFARLADTIALAVRFFDNVIDPTCFPLHHIDRMTKQTRKIGLGIMGLADLLIALNIPYNSETALHMATTLMDFFDPVPISHRQSWLPNVESFPPIEAAVSKHVTVCIETQL